MQADKCVVPTAWNVEILTPQVNFDPFLQSYQRIEPIRRQLSTGGLADGREVVLSLGGLQRPHFLA